jgi:4-amino-4-deoxy-L-arabinose transferase-like glycosyltransferase
MPGASRPRRVLRVVAAVLVLAGLLLLAGLVLPFERLKPLADHLALDGSLESFTTARLAQIRPGLLVVALACLAAGGLVYYYREDLERRLGGLQRISVRHVIRHDLRMLGDSLRAELGYKTELGVLALIMLLAAATRGLYLSQPMLHDEAYTFIAFASRPFLSAISDYSLPNNHIFHTLLVYLAYHLLGNQPWIIRLPAYLAGIAIVPLTYAAGAIFYNRNAGLLSAGLAAASPLLIDYSANARGYTLVCAITLVAVILAAYVKDQRNFIAWVLLALACALGFYTIPIMLYPAGMVFAWLILSGLLGDTSAEYKKTFWGYLLVACLLLAGLAALLYTPVFIKSGIGVVVNNSYVRPDDPELSPIFGEGLLEQVRSRVSSTAEQWTGGVPWAIGALSLVGLAASLALHRRISRAKIPLQAAALLWIALAISIQRVAPLARVWMFLLPLYITWASAGVLGLAGLALPERYHLQGRWAVFLAAVLVPAAVFIAAIPGTASMRGAPGAEEGVTRYLKEHIQPGDRVAAQSPISTPLEYYFLQYGLPQEAFDTQKGAPQTLWVVASRRYDQTLESVLKRRGFEALISEAPSSPAYQYKHIAVYKLQP